MKCKFNEITECPNTELFDKWKDDKKETAWLTLGVCPECHIYKGDIDFEITMVDRKEVKHGIPGMDT